jgi:translation initiation factor IF-2
MSSAVKQLASRDHVQVRIFDVIYKLLDDAKASMEAILAPDVVETEIGKITIRGVFRTLRDEVIAGGEVTSGKAVAGVLARVIRGDEKLMEVEVEKVQRQQQEAKEVFEGEMCGISLKTPKKLLIEEGDKLELFTRELVKRVLK